MIQKKIFFITTFLITTVSFLIISCDTDVISPISSLQNDTTATVVLKMKADFGNQLKKLAFKNKKTNNDNPGLPAGSDSDNDGGIVSFSTPRNFTGAFRNVFIYNNNNDTLSLIKNTQTLDSSTIIDMTQPVIVDEVESELVNYTNIHTEVYYLDMNLELNNPNNFEWVRIYMSDDDFPNEGNLGHHQGDIVLLDNNQAPLGWVRGCTPWTTENVEPTRKSYIMGAGGIDPETGHIRGFFGNTEFWNSTDHMQGTSQDIFIIDMPISVNITTPGTITITISFDIENSWYFEDFDNNGVFSPGGNNIEMCTEGSTWAPLIPTPEFSVSTN